MGQPGKFQVALVWYFVFGKGREVENPINKILDEVAGELDRATRKFPTWPTDPLHALAVVGEEFGELTQATLEYIYEPHKSDMSDVRKEAIQSMTMMLRFLMSLDDYEFSRCKQHEQFRVTTSSMK